VIDAPASKVLNFLGRRQSDVRLDFRSAASRRPGGELRRHAVKAFRGKHYRVLVLLMVLQMAQYRR
jgi:hypothetical protein